MRRLGVLLSIGFLLFLIGGLCLLGPFRISKGSERIQVSVGPGIEKSADILLNIWQGQSAKVSIVFENVTQNGQLEVWPLIQYMFPTKLLIETVHRFVNQSEVNFVLGRENASFLTTFITQFSVRFFFSGNTSVLANTVIVILENPATIPGIALLFCACIPIWSVVWSSRKYFPS